MSTIAELLSLRRQVVQARLDATQLLHTARNQGDQRKVDHLSGKAMAYQMIIDMIDIQLQLDDDDESNSPGRRRRA
ncbi:hypothetical protein [Fodinicola acaciae]|uniref:hypothetical protein n=1 Tax=Fodinicola acaciae TaxID=2681555 RepID=UPI0013D0FF3B|nr:hypothetical protein [Fodinicola acaciae]